MCLVTSDEGFFVSRSVSYMAQMNATRIYGTIHFEDEAES